MPKLGLTVFGWLDGFGGSGEGETGRFWQSEMGPAEFFFLGHKDGHGSRPMGSHFGVSGAPPILEPIFGGWIESDVHWGLTGVLTHGHIWVWVNIKIFKSPGDRR